MKDFFDRRVEGFSWVDCSSREDLNFLSITKVPILVARYAGMSTVINLIDFNFHSDFNFKYCKTIVLI